MNSRHQYAAELLRTGLLEGLASFAELEARLSALPTSGERGHAFEAFAEAYWQHRRWSRRIRCGLTRAFRRMS